MFKKRRFSQWLKERLRARIWQLQGRRPSLQEQYPHFAIGRASYGDLKILEWGNDAQLRIGAFCSISNEVTIFLGGEHHIDWVTTYPFPALWPSASHIKGHPLSKGDVVIGNDVWIGYKATILSGVTIGDGAVVGAHSLVTKDVPPYTIVAGNPAKIVRKRFDDATIERLLKIAWWNWDDQTIEHFLPLLLQNDIAAFLTAAESLQSDR